MNNDQKIDILAAVPAEAGSAFAALDDESARRPLDDGWTPLEILGHPRTPPPSTTSAAGV
jgi:hypothetical protein